MDKWHGYANNAPEELDTPPWVLNQFKGFLHLLNVSWLYNCSQPIKGERNETFRKQPKRY
ncbi:hypothetical protein STSR3_10 [Salmonella virus STSR3]|nr:hypothetical protein STSR3_10 [Salmonella virus STSR3]